MTENYIPTDLLAKKLEVETFELLDVLKKLKWIVRENNRDQLTGEGKRIGGIIKKR
ncbi:MAG: hypothetical protein LBP74_08510 [Treponema sp.]|nr:hypothetical protein [Treponema sp.]